MGHIATFKRDRTERTYLFRSMSSSRLGTAIEGETILPCSERLVFRNAKAEFGGGSTKGSLVGKMISNSERKSGLYFRSREVESRELSHFEVRTGLRLAEADTAIGGSRGQMVTVA